MDFCDGGQYTPARAVFTWPFNALLMPFLAVYAGCQNFPLTSGVRGTDVRRLDACIHAKGFDWRADDAAYVRFSHFCGEGNARVVVMSLYGATQRVLG